MTTAPAVARHRNFNRAAQELHVAQPVLSRQIRALETKLGAALFVRDSRGAALTPADAQLALDAEPLLADAETLRRKRRPRHARASHLHHRLHAGPHRHRARPGTRP